MLTPSGLCSLCWAWSVSPDAGITWIEKKNRKTEKAPTTIRATEGGIQRLKRARKYDLEVEERRMETGRRGSGTGDARGKRGLRDANILPGRDDLD